MKRFAASADSETVEAATEKAPVNQFIHSVALVALAGLGANTVEVALYPKIEQDADGNTLLNFL